MQKCGKRWLCGLLGLALTATASLAACTEGEKPNPNGGAEIVPVAPLEGLKLCWSDEFEGTSLDRTKWNYQLGIRDVYHDVVSNTLNWGNNELQYYTEDAVSVQDGSLVITAERREYEGMGFTSGRIVTRDLAKFTYGYFEAKMRTPAIEGMWPAFWMLPQPTDTHSTDNVYGGWATNGEIDIMEAKGRLGNVIDNTLHFGGSWPNNKYKSQSYTMETNTEEWHVYGIEWREDHMTWYIDGNVSHSMKSSDWYSDASDSESAPFDVPFYLLFDLAVGGNYDGGRKPAESFRSASMYVDYVRVFQ